MKLDTFRVRMRYWGMPIVSKDSDCRLDWLTWSTLPELSQKCNLQSVSSVK